MQARSPQIILASMGAPMGNRLGPVTHPTIPRMLRACATTDWLPASAGCTALSLEKLCVYYESTSCEVVVPTLPFVTLIRCLAGPRRHARYGRTGTLELCLHWQHTMTPRPPARPHEMVQRAWASVHEKLHARPGLSYASPRARTPRLYAHRFVAQPAVSQRWPGECYQQHRLVVLYWSWSCGTMLSLNSLALSLISSSFCS